MYRKNFQGYKFLGLTGVVAMLLAVLICLMCTNIVSAQSAVTKPEQIAVNQTQDIADTGQGTLHAGKDLCIVFKNTKAEGGYKAVSYSTDKCGFSFLR
jgi:hypothetical protein